MICALHNWERLGIRIIFQDGVVTGDDLGGVLYSAAQFKTNTPVTSFANRKLTSCQQHGLMHQAVLVMSHAVNTALWHKLARPVFLDQNLFVLHCFKRPEYQ